MGTPRRSRANTPRGETATATLDWHHRLRTRGSPWHVRFTSSFWAPAPGAPPWPRSRHTTHRRCCGRAIRTPSRRSTSGDATADISATVSFRTGYAPQRTLPKLPTKPMFWWWACLARGAHDARTDRRPTARVGADPVTREGPRTWNASATDPGGIRVPARASRRIAVRTEHRR